MKGILHKTEQGWIVIYDQIFGEGIVKRNQHALPLHPDDVKQINKDAQIFDNIEARIAAYPEVEFEIVTEWENGEVGVNGLTYAKLIHHSVDSNEMIDHIGEVNEMVNQTAVEWLVNELENHHVFQDIKNTVAYQQALAMEKEQMADAFGVGCQVESTRLIGYHEMAEQYYNKTYNKGENKVE